MSLAGTPALSQRIRVAVAMNASIIAAADATVRRERRDRVTWHLGLYITALTAAVLIEDIGAQAISWALQ